ncbi:NAD-dependent epimerase/dehydratase family protein [Cohaesibacter marisflavi]|uniref:NAD-dependent epimerase/dehydratase family protein n=1 Tax=Cohaesibacter marisflavi TaxID=655353 RepID=UPI0029C78359|nr:NAD-dependent epimerase/dehydratase family protein [Cohaesibacter marisflavi]
MTKTVLITGGAGYIGSTIAHILVTSGFKVVIIDSLDNGYILNSPESACFYNGRISEKALYECIRCELGKIDVTIHCASYISVPESEVDPVKYITNNVSEFVELLENLPIIDCKRLIFSSSASIYGNKQGALKETSAIGPQSTYAETKWLCEQIGGLAAEQGPLRIINLRYFNPIGTHPDGYCGPGDLNSGSLLNELTKAILSHTPFQITGTDYDTRDGSGIRDYVDVTDLAMAHAKACSLFDTLIDERAALDGPHRTRAINLGSGDGVTVKELIAAAEKALGRKIRTKKAPRRPGDVAGSYADASLAKDLLQWQASTPLETSILRHIDWWQRHRHQQPAPTPISLSSSHPDSVSTSHQP